MHAATPPRCFVLAAGCAAPGCSTPAEAFEQAWSSRRPRPAPRSLDAAALAAGSALPARTAKRMDRFSQLAVAAARAALPTRPAAGAAVGMVVGNMTGGWGYTEPELRKLHSVGLADVSPYLASAWFPAAAQGQASIQLGLEGWAKTVATDRCCGGQAIGLAARQLCWGRAQQLLAGGAEAPVTPFVEAAYAARFGEVDLLTEAAAFLLLAARPAADDAGVLLHGHVTRALFSDEALRRQVADLLGEPAPPADRRVLFVNTMAHAGIEAEVLAGTAQAGVPRAQVIFANRRFGDSLAAAAPLAAVAAYESIRRGVVRTAGVLSVGHQCLDIFFLTDGKPT